MKTYINIKTKYKPKDIKELTNLVENLSIKLWEIDTSLIIDMKGLFLNSKRKNNKDFEGIECWDVSNVIDMAHMFSGCSRFNQPLNKWDVSNVKRMFEMFYGCKNFNQPLDKWNVSNVTDMGYMFEYCHKFNQPLNDWDVSNVTSMHAMFQYCYKFNQPLDKWDVSNATSVRNMFAGCEKFNQPLNNWIFNIEADKCFAFFRCNIEEKNKPKGAYS